MRQLPNFPPAPPHSKHQSSPNAAIWVIICDQSSTKKNIRVIFYDASRVASATYRKRLKHCHCVLFYPKFHCELNSIERYWCQAKWFARENCGYDFEALEKTVPEALASVTNASIRGFYRLAVRTIDAYSAGLCYGTEEFKHNVYRSHRQVEDKSKW